MTEPPPITSAFITRACQDALVDTLAGRAESGKPSHPPGPSALHAVAHAEQDGSAEFGEQTDEILGQFGFSKDEIGNLRQHKIV